MRIFPTLVCLFYSACLLAQTKYDWSEILVTPPDSHHTAGNQILHFKSKNKHFSESPEAAKFVEKNLSLAMPLQSDADVLRFASDQVCIEGAYLEMGVCTAKTINFIAALNPLQRIYGFDSFEGLPEDWVRDDKIFPKETFAFLNPEAFPYVLHNVTLYKGWFQDSLPIFKENVLHDLPIAFLHIDCDLYSSTQDVFHALGNNIVHGTVIVFDELYNFPGYQKHELKALQEFLEAREFEAEYLAYNIFHQQVAIRIKAPSCR